MQAAYQLQVGTSEASLTRSADLLWDSGKVTFRSLGIVEYRGRQRCRVLGTTGACASGIRTVARLPGLCRVLGDRAVPVRRLDRPWIGPKATASDGLPSPSPLLRRAFRIDDQVRTARLYVTSLGLYEGLSQRTADRRSVLHARLDLVPPSLQYRPNDVTPLLRPGANVVGACSATAVPRNLGFFGHRNLYGRTACLTRAARDSL